MKPEKTKSLFWKSFVHHVSPLSAKKQGADPLRGDMVSSTKTLNVSDRTAPHRTADALTRLLPASLSLSLSFSPGGCRSAEG